MTGQTTHTVTINNTQKKHTLETPDSIAVKVAGETRTELLVNSIPSPITIDVKTDWANVTVTVIGSVVTAILVAYIARMGQRDQLRVSSAGIRKEWQLELRKACAEMMGITALLSFHNRTRSQNGGGYEGEHLKLYMRFFELRATIQFLLDPDASKKLSEPKKLHHNELEHALLSLGESLNVEGEDHLQKLNEARQSFAKAAKLVLEDAWDDVKNDLQGQ